MVSVYEMQKVGYDVQIFEFNGCVGGCCWIICGGDEYIEFGGFKQICEFDWGLYINFGFWCIFCYYYVYFYYVCEFGVKFELFIMENWNVYIYCEGKNGQ